MEIGIKICLVVFVATMLYWWRMSSLVKNTRTDFLSIRLKNDIFDHVKNIINYINKNREDMYSLDNLALIISYEEKLKQDLSEINSARNSVINGINISKDELYAEIENTPSVASNFFDPTFGVTDESHESFKKHCVNGRLAIRKKVVDIQFSEMINNYQILFENKIFSLLNPEVKTSSEMKEYISKLVELAHLFISSIEDDKNSEFFEFKFLVVDRVKVILECIDSELAISFKDETQHLLKLNPSF